jgi:hypothetical protein
MNEAFSISDRTLCRPCLEEFLSSQPDGSVQPGSVAPLADATVCARCSADNGDDEWPTVAGLPACTTCELFLRNRPFPAWLKISMAVFLCVAGAAFLYNWRFFMGYVELVRGQHALEDGQVERGMALYASAAARIPEMPELSVLPNFFEAQKLIAEEMYDEGLDLLRRTRQFAGPDMAGVYRQVELQAEIGKAFDGKDYDAFLAFANEAAELAPDSPSALGGVASAYACKYAVSGDESFRRQSLEHLERARAMARADHEEFKEYETRIQHRLHTREILSREQFYKEFPNGWKPEAGS